MSDLAARITARAALCAAPSTPVSADEVAVELLDGGMAWVRADDAGPRRPSRNDPATLGCLMELVETALGAPIAVKPAMLANTTIEQQPIRGWGVLVYHRACGTPVPYPSVPRPTKWDALVAALAAAPGRAS
jgi:hypothetical protein